MMDTRATRRQRNKHISLFPTGSSHPVSTTTVTESKPLSRDHCDILLFDEINCIEPSRCLMAVCAGKTELAKQVARYMHKDIKKVSQ